MAGPMCMGEPRPAPEYQLNRKTWTAQEMMAYMRRGAQAQRDRDQSPEKLSLKGKTSKLQQNVTNFPSIKGRSKGQLRSDARLLEPDPKANTHKEANGERGVSIVEPKAQQKIKFSSEEDHSLGTRTKPGI